MKLNTKQKTILFTVDIIIASAFAAAAFMILPKALDFSGASVYTVCDYLIVSLPMILVTFIGTLIFRRVWCWLLPDLVYCSAMLTTASENYHPYGVGMSGGNFAYKTALCHTLTVLAALILVQLVPRLIIALIRAIRKHGRKKKSVSAPEG